MFTPAPAAPAPALQYFAALKCTNTVVTKEIGRNGGGNKIVFILAASYLTLVQSIFIKQTILAPAPDPQNNFGSGSALAPRNTASKILTGLRLTDLNLEENYLFQASGQHSTLQPLRTR